MEKIVLFNTYSGNIDMIVRVKNFDDHFMEAAKEGRELWNNSQEEYSAFMIDYLTNVGYNVSYIDEEYEIFTDYTE